MTLERFGGDGGDKRADLKFDWFALWVDFIVGRAAQDERGPDVEGIPVSLAAHQPAKSLEPPTPDCRQSMPAGRKMYQNDSDRD